MKILPSKSGGGDGEGKKPKNNFTSFRGAVAWAFMMELISE